MADPFAAFVDPFAAFAEPYHAPAGHGTAAMLGAPSEPYAEGVNPAESTTNKIAAGLEPLAHPQSWSDIGNLMLAPTDATRGALASLKPIGRGLGAVGESVEGIGNDLPSKYSMPGSATLALTGHYKPAIAAAVVPPMIRGTGKAMQAMGRLMAGGAEAAPAAEAVQPMKASDFLGSLQEMAPAERQAAMRTRMSSVADARAAGTFADAPKPGVIERLRPTTPEAGEQVPHPALTRTNPSAMPSHGATALEPMPSHAPANTADVNVSTPLGDPKVTNVNPKYPWSPDQASQIRLGMSDWHSGTGGTPAARGAQNLHIEDHMLDQRYRQLLSDPKAALLLPLLAPQVREALLSQMRDRSE